MKKVIIFIALKIVEVSLVVFGPYYLGMWVHSWPMICNPENHTAVSCPPNWVMGFLSLVLTVIAVLATCVVIYWNWEWANKLHRRIT